MKQGIHPEYNVVTVKCACGAEYTTRSTKNDVKVEICACALHHVLEHGMDFTAESLREMLTFANAAASLITMRKGAMCAMPAAEEVADLVRTASN